MGAPVVHSHSQGLQLPQKQFVPSLWSSLCVQPRFHAQPHASRCVKAQRHLQCLPRQRNLLWGLGGVKSIFLLQKADGAWLKMNFPEQMSHCHPNPWHAWLSQQGCWHRVSSLLKQLSVPFTCPWAWNQEKILEREENAWLCTHCWMRLCPSPQTRMEMEQRQAAVEQSSGTSESSLVFGKSPHKTIPVWEGTEGKPFFARQKLTALRGPSPISSSNQPTEVNPSNGRIWLLCLKVKLMHLS